MVESFVLKLKMHTPPSMDGMHIVLESVEHLHYNLLLVLVCWKLFSIYVKMKIAAHRSSEMNNGIKSVSNNSNRTAEAVETVSNSRRKEGISNENYYGNDKRPCSKPPVVFIYINTAFEMLKNAHALTK